MSLAQQVLDGNRLALARLLTQVENDTLEGRAALNEVFPYTGEAHLIGVTGAPGTGKSSLVNQLVRYFRQGEALPEDEGNRPRVAVVAVDPSSPFTGGAILGDRVRMRDLSGDPGVFIRSMASRGSLGGLAATTAGIVQVLDAAGYRRILIETVGAGQAEVEIARLAHTTLVVEAPGMGDDIQAIKAGIMEIADILVVNKADRPGAEATERALRNMLQLAHPAPRIFRDQGRNHVTRFSEEEAGLSDGQVWIPPILRAVATEGEGIPELAEAIGAHYRYLHESGEWGRRERARLKAELDLLLRDTLVTRWRSSLPEEQYQQVLRSLAAREMSPRQAVRSLLDSKRD